MPASSAGVFGLPQALTAVRLLNGLGALVLLGAIAWLLAERSDPVLRSADALRGERWYRLLLDDRHVGYLHTRIRRDVLGDWRFDSDLRFVLTRGNPIRIEERLDFAGTRPFELRQASQRHNRAGLTDGTRIQREDRDGARYTVERVTVGGDGGSGPAPLDLTFQLGDYLGFETWLRRGNRPNGATVTSSALDFARQRVVARQFRVLERNAVGYRLENPAPLDPTVIQLDDRLRPVTMTLSGLFELEQTTRTRALAPRTALQAASYFVPVDRRLPNHTRIESLTLAVDGRHGAMLWPRRLRQGLLTQSADAITTPALRGDELAETADHPVNDRRIRELARQAVAGIDDDRARVEALTTFVHGYLRYEDEATRHVLTLLDQPAGDCSEYADLLTTLARSLGIPARTVFGLAYADGPPPAFRYHAWNELRVDGTWLAVDPTWNQQRLDATHIALPDNPAVALEYLTGGLDLAFTVRDIAYF